MKRLHRNLDDMTFAANVTTTIDLPQEFVMMGLHLELEGNLAITGDITLIDEVPQSLIRRIELIADGEALQVWTGNMLAAYNYFQHGRYLNREVPAVAINDPENFRQHFFLPFKICNVPTPGFTYFDPTRFRSVQLRVTWGTTTDIFSAGTATFNAATLRTVTAELMASANQLSESGRFADFITTHIVDTSAVANTSHKVNLPRDFDIWGILMRVSDSATGKVVSDVLLNAIKIQERGTLNTWDLSYNMAQNIQQTDFGLTEDMGTPAVDGSRVEGYVFIDLLERGLVDRVKPQSWYQFDLVLDVDAATRLDIIPLQIRN